VSRNDDDNNDDDDSILPSNNQSTNQSYSSLDLSGSPSKKSQVSVSRSESKEEGDERNWCDDGSGRG
jgi:hypothetical protein